MAEALLARTSDESPFKRHLLVTAWGLVFTRPKSTKDRESGSDTRPASGACSPA